MNKDRFLADWNTISKTELYGEMVKWAGEQQKLFQGRCSNGKDVDEWRRNQGRVDAFAKVGDMLLHPEKLLDKVKGETTTTTGEW